MEGLRRVTEDNGKDLQDCRSFVGQPKEERVWLTFKDRKFKILKLSRNTPRRDFIDQLRTGTRSILKLGATKK
jgi:hypothetical protein